MLQLGTFTQIDKLGNTPVIVFRKNDVSSISHTVCTWSHQQPSRDCKKIHNPCYGTNPQSSEIKQSNKSTSLIIINSECHFSWLNDRRCLTRSSFNDSGICEIKVDLASAINSFLQAKVCIRRLLLMIVRYNKQVIIMLDKMHERKMVNASRQYFTRNLSLEKLIKQHLL